MLALTDPMAIINGGVATTTVYDKIVQDQLVDAVMTNQGERIMHPTWGCNIQGLLYDPASSLERQDAASYIRDLLIHMVPRAIVMSVDVSVEQGAPNVVHIDIVYKTSNYSPASSVSVAVDTTAGVTQ
jgi:phage baseplate assembly protein W